MGKFSGGSSTPQAPKLITKTEKVGEEDNSAKLARAAEKRRKGRRASILSNISGEDLESTSISRPFADVLSKTFGG